MNPNLGIGKSTESGKTKEKDAYIARALDRPTPCTAESAIGELMRHWLVFGDDTGDPGGRRECTLRVRAGCYPGGAHAGIRPAARAVPHRTKIFVESKPKKSKNVHISGGLANLHALSDLHEARVAVALIHKSAYRGYWLRQNGEIPANSNFLQDLPGAKGP